MSWMVGVPPGPGWGTLPLLARPGTRLSTGPVTGVGDAALKKTRDQRPWGTSSPGKDLGPEARGISPPLTGKHL